MKTNERVGSERRIEFLRRAFSQRVRRRAFGPGRGFLLTYRAGLSPESWERLSAAFGDAVIPLSDADAARYAANSFTLTRGTDSILVMPAGLSEHLLGQVRDRSVIPLTVDVSEFLEKGGGSVKRMIGDLRAVRGGVTGPLFAATARWVPYAGL